MPEIKMRQIDGKYHLWLQGEFYGIINDLDELSNVFKDEIIPMVKEEQENERNNHQDPDQVFHTD